ncbi:hypothetical protein [Paenibacillus ferrarius]|uniref:hypothetical protein n=1 Tax=Paenibacillus ferrarius TaxID=1469647 RepID=UPI003D2B5C46
MQKNVISFGVKCLYSFHKPHQAAKAASGSVRQSSQVTNIGQSHVITLQRTIGNRATAQFLTSNSPFIQRTLSEENKELVKKDLIEFYTAKKQAKAKYDTLFMPDAKKLEEKFKLPKEDLRQYYKELLKNELEPPVTSTTSTKNGVLALSTIRNAPFTGSTAGQSYINSPDYLGYENHISVSYTPDAIKETATITGLHVSFKGDNNEIRFWYYVNSGQITYRTDNNPTGARNVGAIRIGQLQTKADALINNRLGLLKCSY